jgi:hypothetical protein
MIVYKSNTFSPWGPAYRVQVLKWGPLCLSRRQAVWQWARVNCGLKPEFARRNSRELHTSGRGKPMNTNNQFDGVTKEQWDNIDAFGHIPAAEASQPDQLWRWIVGVFRGICNTFSR